MSRPTGACSHRVSHRLTASAAKLPFAPTRFSTTKDWPSLWERRLATRRATTSGDEPAACPTTILTAGQDRLARSSILRKPKPEGLPRATLSAPGSSFRAPQSELRSNPTESYLFSDPRSSRHRPSFSCAARSEATKSTQPSLPAVNSRRHRQFGMTNMSFGPKVNRSKPVSTVPLPSATTTIRASGRSHGRCGKIRRQVSHPVRDRRRRPLAVERIGEAERVAPMVIRAVLRAAVWRAERVRSYG